MISNCPYCKYRSVYVDCVYEIFEDEYQVRCNGCGMGGPLEATEDEAIEAWEQLCSMVDSEEYRRIRNNNG